MHQHGTMTAERRELLVARIISGVVRITVGGLSYLFSRPRRQHLYVAQEAYQEALSEAQLRGIFTDEELLTFLLENSLWDNKSQVVLDELPAAIDELKLNLFRAGFRSLERNSIRTSLAEAKHKLHALEARRHAYDHLSCHGCACSARTWYVLGCSLRDAKGKRVFKPRRFWEQSNELLQEAASELARARLAEHQYRELARTEPWRSTWSARSTGGSLFGVPACDYTDEQRSLAAYSGLYDGVYQHPECPSDEDVADDDVLDGWLINQREKRRSSSGASPEGLIGNDKIRNSQEVYLVAQTPEDARKVMDLNDAHGKAVQKQRFAALREKGDKGDVAVMDLPDVKRRGQMAAAERLAQEVRGR